MSTQPGRHADLIQGLARVVAVDRDQVWLVAEQPGACGSCATRSACGSGRSKPAASWRAPRSLGPGQPALALGETVHIGVDRSALTRASVTAYVLPLAAMLAAVIGLREAGDAVVMAAALGGLLVGVAAARVVTRRWRGALVPVVLGRAAAGSACTPAGAGALRSLAVPVIEQRRL